MDSLFSNSASAIFAIGLIIPVAISTMDFNTRPTWHRATSFLALVLVLLGYASSLFLSMHFQDHHAYLVAYTASTLGACWLVVASIMNMHRLFAHLQALAEVDIRIFRLSRKVAVAILCLLQTAAVACFAVGSKHLAIVHSEKPIQGLADVLARVESEERSKSSMLAGHVLETIVLVSFSIVLLGLWRYIPLQSTKTMTEQSNNVKAKKLVRTAFHGMAATVLSILVRTTFHVAEFFMTDPEGLEVAATSTLGFYLDLAPVFCKFRPLGTIQCSLLTKLRCMLGGLSSEHGTKFCRRSGLSSIRMAWQRKARISLLSLR